MIIFLVAAMNRDLLGAADGAEDQARLFHRSYFHVFLAVGLLVEDGVFILPRYLNVVLHLVKFVAVELVQPLRILRNEFIALEQMNCAQLLVDAL